MTKNNLRYLLSEDGTRQFKYFAFISYKRVDEPVAKKLKKMLELYSLPMKLRKEADRPRHLSPICRDEDNWTMGPDVYTQMNQKLKESKFLIVLCSRNMQKNPEYINYEIKTFLELGNPVSHILPLIIDGEGCARDPLDEAFPPALLEMKEDIRPRGAKMDLKKPKDAVLELVAAMHGIDRSSLKSLERERRQKRIVSSLTAALAMFVFFAGFMMWEVLSVKQARLREQNVYAQNSYEKGDRRQANIISSQILNENSPLIDEEIISSARRINFLSSVKPLLSPTAMLEPVYSNTNAFFTSSGEEIIISNPDGIRFYNLEGEPLREVLLTKLGQQFIEISPDGKYAITLSVFEAPDEITLWLCSLTEQKRICPLVTVNEKYVDDRDVTTGNYNTVADAAFSPDGSLVCAYRTGGYYNESALLEVYSVVDGEPVISLDASLLGSSGQGNTIEFFEFLSDSLFHWEGPLYHIIYDMENGETHRISKKDYTTSGRGIEAHGHLRILPTENGDGTSRVQFCNFLLDEPTVEINFSKHTVKKQDCMLIDDRIAFVMAANSSNTVKEILVMNMENMMPIYIDHTLFEKYNSIQAEAVSGTPIVYLIFYNENSSSQDYVFLRINTNTGEISPITVKNIGKAGDTIKALGKIDQTEWFICNKDNKTTAVAITNGNTSIYYLDELYSVFSKSISISKSNMLLSVHENEYTLYPLTCPGINVDGIIDWSALSGDVQFDASEDGKTIVKAKENQFIIYSENGDLIKKSMENPVQSVSITADGSKILFADAHTLFLFKKDGTLLTSKKIEDGFQMKNAVFVPDGSRILQAIEYEKIEKLCSSNLFLLDGDTLESIEFITNVFHPVGKERDIVDGNDYKPFPAFDVSADSKYFAVVETEHLAVVLGIPEYSRFVSVFSTSDGKRIAGGPLQQEDAKLLDMQANPSQSVGFNYVRFAKSGNLLAGFNHGLWKIDTNTFDTQYISAASSFCSAPEELSDKTVLYPGNGLHRINSQTGISSGIFAVEDDFIIHLSENEEWVCVTSSSKTEFVCCDDISIHGILSNQPVDIVYIDENKIIYNTENGLYIIKN